MSDISAMKKAIEKFFDEVAHGRIDDSMAYFSDDVEMRVPFQPVSGGFWSQTSGKEELRRFLGSIPKIFDEHRIIVDEFLPIPDMDTLVAKYHGEFTVKRTGKPYQNTYIAVFTFRDALISSWTEYHNPLVLLEAFAE